MIAVCPSLPGAPSCFPSTAGAVAEHAHLRRGARRARAGATEGALHDLVQDLGVNEDLMRGAGDPGTEEENMKPSEPLAMSDTTSADTVHRNTIARRSPAFMSHTTVYQQPRYPQNTTHLPSSSICGRVTPPPQTIFPYPTPILSRYTYSYDHTTPYFNVCNTPLFQNYLPLEPSPPLHRPDCVGMASQVASVATADGETEEEEEEEEEEESRRRYMLMCTSPHVLSEIEDVVIGVQLKTVESGLYIRPATDV